MITEARIASLPKWARQEIERLQRNEAAHVALLTAGPEDSDTFADPYGHTRPLGRGTTIVFRLGDGDGRDSDIRIRTEVLRDGRTVLDVNGGVGGLAVFPRASNSVEIGSRGR